MDFLISSAFAQGAGPAGQPSAFPSMLVMIGFFAIFYFIAIRPQMKRAKEHRQMIAALAKGDEVVTSGGIVGRVEDLGDAFVKVEIADKVTIKIQRHAISAVLPKGTIKSA